jgi:hypothetical protein
MSIEEAAGLITLTRLSPALRALRSSSVSSIVRRATRRVQQDESCCCSLKQRGRMGKQMHMSCGSDVGGGRRFWGRGLGPR